MEYTQSHGAFTRNDVIESFAEEIGKHVRNIFKEGELVKEAVWAKFAGTASAAKTLSLRGRRDQ